VKELTSLKQIPTGASVFIDSNILTFFLLGANKHYFECKTFLNRIAKGEIHGKINSVVVTETLFNFVKERIVTKHKIRIEDFIRFVKKNPATIKDINIKPCKDIFSMPNIELISPTLTFINEKFVLPLPLLSNDLYHYITMKYAEINNLASDDKDFNNIEGITVWNP